MERNIQEIIQKIKDLIAAGQIKEALEDLLNAFPTDKDIFSHNSRYNVLQKNEGKGIVSYTDYNLEYNKIREALLNKIDELEKDNTNTQPMDSNKQKADGISSVINKVDINGDYNVALVGVTAGRDIIIERPKPPISLEDLHTKANNFLNSNPPDHEQALNYLNEAINKDKKFVDAYVTRGFIWLQQEKYMPAIADFKEALVLNPEHCVALNNLIASYIKIENYQEAFCWAEKGIENKCSQKLSEIKYHYEQLKKRKIG